MHLKHSSKQSKEHDNSDSIRFCQWSLSAYHRLALISLFIFFLSASLNSNADTLVIPDISSQPDGQSSNTPRPARSMSMEEVRTQFGSPMKVMGPIGNPPITRWEYDNFVVTFESEYVIHSVVKRKR